jgi:alpha-mannosidase
MRLQDRHRWERHKRRVEELNFWRTAGEHPVEEWLFDSGNGGGTRRVKLGDFWPEMGLPVTLKAETEIPTDWEGQHVELELWLGGEGYVRLSNGITGGLNPFHRTFPVTGGEKNGQVLGIEAEVVSKSLFGSNIAEPRIERAALVVPEREVRGLERDLAVISGVCKELDDHEAVPHLLDAVDAALSALAGHWPSSTPTVLSRFLAPYEQSSEGAPWGVPDSPGKIQPLPDETRRAVSEARAVLAAKVEEIKEEYPPVGRIALTGHAHLDLAWLWPVAETRRKGRRTFSSVLSLMDRYPDFTFNQSSAQLYRWIEQDAPELFERIRERVKEGRIEPIGGSWVEPDSQMPSGESYVRQLFYGQRYFEEKFGRRSTVAWLPDTFGFSPGVPQLLRGAGLRGFFTYKMNWSETNEFPYDLYEWEGLDGSTIVGHDFENPGSDYNGNICPCDLYGVWKNFEGKRLHNESIFSFGWGDGGGGPSEEMLENYGRLKDFPAMPRLRMTGVEEFFASLPEEGLPRWVGELYLELHRGTLTTQAKVKKLNREAEHRLLEAEAFSTIAALLGEQYPGADLEEAWKKVLLNQFHDVLPGSSVPEVYKDAHRELAESVQTATEARDAALKTLSGGGEGAVLVSNAGLNPRSLTAVIPHAGTIADRKGNPLPTQQVEGGLLVHDPARRVPGLGWTVLREGDGEALESGDAVRIESTDGGVVLENSLLRVEVGDGGSLTRVYDREAGREVLTGVGNKLMAYTDKPRNWEAWDVDPEYELEPEEVPGARSVEVVEEGPLRAAVRVVRRWRSSTITQTYRLLSGSRRVDIETHVDWHERRMLLRTLFPMNVRSHEATFETMFGAVRRPTHRNTSWDAARFEVSAHRWCDLSEPGYGVALLNDGKYGHSVRDNVLGISLLRGSLYPDPLADEGEHSFTYSLYPHPGDWTEGGVVEEAFTLNSPLVTTAAGEEAEEGSLVRAEGLTLALGGLKKVEEGEALILRLYEPRGARGESVLHFAGGVGSIERTNLLEEPEGEAPEVVGDAVHLSVRPFEVVTLRVEPGNG